METVSKHSLVSTERPEKVGAYPDEVALRFIYEEDDPAWATILEATLLEGVDFKETIKRELHLAAPLCLNTSCV